MLNELNDIFEKSKEDDLITGIETFVALLRNKEKANQVDVKIYLSDLSKLQFKMNTIQPEALTIGIVQKHIETFDKISKFFKNPDTVEYRF